MSELADCPECGEIEYDEDDVTADGTGVVCDGCGMFIVIEES
jgi:predicted nucleic-acid-binding Zn-ribbon protein